MSIMSIMSTISDTDNNYRNRFLCKNCKKMLISKESLDNHIISCFESKIERILENHKKEIEDLKKNYDKKIEELFDYMLDHINKIEKKHTDVNSYLLTQLTKMASLD